MGRAAGCYPLVWWFESIRGCCASRESRGERVENRDVQESASVFYSLLSTFNFLARRRSRRPMVRMPGLQPENVGSIPLGRIKFLQREAQVCSARAYGARGR